MALPTRCSHFRQAGSFPATLALGCFFLSGAAAQSGDNWPEFRGPTGDGHAGGSDLPVRWSETENIRWKTPIHDKGWSSPVIWGNQIWLTTARADGRELFVLCLDRDSGKIIRDIKLFDVATPGFCPPVNSYASPTPAIETGRVYVHFGSYGTACLDTATAKVLWSRRDLPCEHYRAPGSSPILQDGLLIVNFDGVDRQYVAALDKRTGETRWQRSRTIDYGTDNGDLKKAFGTPAVIQVGRVPQLISPSAVATIAYEPKTGRELWKVYHGGMNVAARPLFAFGILFVTTGDDAPFRLLAIRPPSSVGTERNVDVDISGPDVTGSSVVWKQNRGVPSRSSLLLVDDLLFMVNEAGMASCLEARTGQVVWQKRLGGTYYASPLYAAGRVYFFDDEGSTHVLEAGRTPRVVARNRLDDGCMASPAVSGNALFVRTRTHLYRIEHGRAAPDPLSR
jgi:outer membrane protein assembly factor BamB